MRTSHKFFQLKNEPSNIMNSIIINEVVYLVVSVCVCVCVCVCVHKLLSLPTDITYSS